MAKQKINTEEEQNTSEEIQEIQDISLQNTEETTVEETISKDKELKETPVKTEKATIHPPELSTLIEGVLKSHPSYEKLYVDSHGGSFSPDTPSCIRGKAILYKNPWYKS